MIPFAECSSGNLCWLKAGHRAYVLECDGLAAGSLRFSGKCGSLATAETANGKWTLKREGFIHPRVTIRTDGSDATVAVFVLSMSGYGRVRVGSHDYSLHGSSWTGSSWEVREGATPMIQFRKEHGNVNVTVLDPIRSSEDLALLLMLGRYVRLLADEDAAVVAILAASS
jgi:hypothetical protein